MAFTFWKPPASPVTGVYQSPVKYPQVPTEAGPRPVLMPVGGGASSTPLVPAAPTVEPPPTPVADNVPSSGTGCANCDIPVGPPALPAITLPGAAGGSPTQVIYPGGERAQPDQMPLTGEGGHATVMPTPAKERGDFPWWLLVVGAGAVYLFTR